MTRASDFALRRLTLSSVVWYATVVGGWALIGFAVVQLETASDVQQVPALAMTAALLIILELLPLVRGRGHDPQGIVMSTAFVCAMLFMWGSWPAIVMIAIASLAADLRAGKKWWRTLFNPAQYGVSVAAAGTFLAIFANAPSLSQTLTTFDLRDLCWVFAASLVYFVVNLGLVAGVLSWSTSFRSVIVDDFRHYATMSFAVLALAPLIVVVGQRAWVLLPLLLIPLFLLYRSAAMSHEREYAVTHDAVTGLLNHDTLFMELTAALVRFRREGVACALLFIDIYNFREVNDTLGHAAGDIMLVKFGERLRETVRAGDLVARLGGDEFAVLVSDATLTEAVTVAERISKGINNSIDLDGLAIEIGASMGLAMCTTNDDAVSLMRRADVAMYRAKRRHSRIEIYTPEHDVNTVDRLSLLGELRQALVDDSLELYYQPKVAISDGRPVGMEALLRWQHPTRGFVPPDDFIPLAERSGIMPLLTERVVRLALSQAAQWRDQGLSLPIAINVSPTDLIGDELCNLVCQGLIEYDLAPGIVMIEITERIDTHLLDDARRTLRRLREVGVGISLDDFGTGYSSLLRLSAIEVDEIKIDRSFVAAMIHNDRTVAIVRTMIELSKSLGMTIVAEGVETEAELARLTALGCDAVQGWHLAIPMPAYLATTWMRERLADRVDETIERSGFVRSVR